MPLRLFSDILYIIVYHLVRYRLKVTRTNLRNAYPDRSRAQLRELEKAYYRHISDLFIEGIHNLYASPRSILRRYHFVNRELVNHYYEKGQSVILLSSHYNNWEYMITSLNFQIRLHAVGVGKPLNDRFVASYITRRRSRFGTQIVDQTDVRKTMAYYHQHHVPCAYMMLSDQSPSNEHKSYWTTFLHQETPFLYGAEYFARLYDLPVLYYEVTKIRRGHYQVQFSTLCEQPSQVPQYTITSRYVQLLTATINAAPQYWLWSHKRWKRHRPADMPLMPNPVETSHTNTNATNILHNTSCPTQQS